MAKRLKDSSGSAGYLEDKILILCLILFPILAGAECSEFTMTPSGLKCMKNPHKQRNQIMADLFMFAGHFADCYTSKKAVDHGATELNPLIPAHNLLACMAVKSIVLLPAATYGWKHDSIKAQLIVGSFGAGFAIWNSFQW